MKTAFSVCILALMLPCTGTFGSDSQNLPLLKPKVKTLAAFKNGLAFVCKTGRTDLVDGWATLDQIPPASLGTLWIGTTDSKRRVEEVVSCKTTSQREIDASSLVELLETNVGSNVVVTYRLSGQSELKQATGTVIAPPPAATEVISPVSSHRPYYPSTPTLLLKSENERILCINKSDICSIELPGNAALKRTVQSETATAKLRVSGNPSSAEITMAYLEKGITWSPSYLIDMADKKTVDITMEAILLNDVEDLDDTDVSFVVGFPSFLYANTLTPLYLQQSVMAFTRALEDSGIKADASPLMSNSMSQAISFDASLQFSPYATTQNPAGEPNQDLYMYNVPHVTMNKGDRARYTVFSASVPCEHTYIWDAVDIGSSGRSPEGNPEQVWHGLKLTNNTRFPWTTAPCLVVNGSMPNAQNTLNYTPVGGTNTFLLTVAPDVRAEQKQTETIRRPVVISKTNYDELIIDGELTIHNFKNEPIKLDINKALTGKVLSCGSGEESRIGSEQAGTNPRSQIEWDFQLEAGAKKTLQYRYLVLIRR